MAHLSKLEGPTHFCGLLIADTGSEFDFRAASRLWLPTATGSPLAHTVPDGVSEGMIDYLSTQGVFVYDGTADRWMSLLQGGHHTDQVTRAPRMWVGPSDPPWTDQEGDLWADTTSPLTLKIYDGSSWGAITSGGGGGVSDHGALTGLGDDDHSIYALLAGRSGGQTLVGGTDAGDDLTLQSTSNATKGQIYFGAITSPFDQMVFREDTGRLGIAVPVPNERITLDGAISFAEESTSPSGISSTSGYGKVYVAQDGRPRFLDSSGTEFDLLHHGAAVQASAPDPVTGKLWLDTSATGSIGRTVTIRTVTADTTLVDSDVVVLCNGTSPGITITLPTAVGREGKIFYVKKIDSSGNSVTIEGDGSETIDNQLFQLLSSQYDAVEVVSDGSEWWII